MNTAQAQQKIIEDFSYFDNWMDRYQHLIDLGRKLEPLPASEKTEPTLPGITLLGRKPCAAIHSAGT